MNGFIYLIYNIMYFSTYLYVYSCVSWDVADKAYICVPLPSLVYHYILISFPCDYETVETEAALPHPYFSFRAR